MGLWKKGTELYDLADDPGERFNLAGKNPEKVAELEALLDRLSAETKAIPPTKNPEAPETFEKW